MSRCRYKNDGDTSTGKIVAVYSGVDIPGGPWNVHLPGDNKVYATFRVSVQADHNHCSGITMRDEVMNHNGIRRITREMVDTLAKKNVGRIVHLVFYSYDGWTFEDLDELDLDV